MPDLSNLLPYLMPRSYKLFISHAWNYADEYDGVVRLLRSDVNFPWTNLSIPIDDPVPPHPVLPKSNLAIVRQLEEKIREADCLLVLAAMYLNHSRWIQSEIELAKENDTPIIAVRPQGQERVPDALGQIGIAELVGWNTNSIISAIKKYTAPATLLPLVPSFNVPSITAPPDFGALTYLQDLMSAGNSSGIPTPTSILSIPALAHLSIPTQSSTIGAVPTSQPSPSPLIDLIDSIRRDPTPKKRF